MLQFVACSVLVMKWAEAVSLRADTRQQTRRAFTAACVFLLAFTLATGFSDEGTAVYYVNLCTLAAASFAIVLLTQVYGALILARFDRGSFNVFASPRTAFGAMKRRTALVLAKIAVVSSVLSLCYCGRFVAYVAFVVRGCDDIDDDDWECTKVLRYFSIQIPDLVPFVTILLALTSLGSAATTIASCCALLGDASTDGDGGASRESDPLIRGAGGDRGDSSPAPSVVSLDSTTGRKPNDRRVEESSDDAAEEQGAGGEDYFSA